MIDPSRVPDVRPNEMLARYILYSKYIRKNQTIKPEAFVPHPRDELSVTRHVDATETELWNLGSGIATAQKKNLHGRGDVKASAFIERQLDVLADPVTDDPKSPPNPNHANVTGWPSGDLGKQKLLALEIAGLATLVVPPSGSACDRGGGIG